MEGYFETVFLIYENTKPNIEVSGLLYQKKTAYHTYIVYSEKILYGLVWYHEKQNVLNSHL